jgi:predicted DNA-binding transcriptional regulator AlpA
MTPAAETITPKTTQHADRSSNPTTAPTDDAGSNREPPRKTAIADGGDRPLLLTAAQSAKTCGISATSWWRLVSKGIAPAPVHPTPASTRWTLKSVLKYIDGLQPQRRSLHISRAKKGEK